MARGIVKFFHDKKGWGFIEADGYADIFVHYADIKGEGHRTLIKGDEVEFEVIAGPKGEKAINVTRLQVH